MMLWNERNSYTSSGNETPCANSMRKSMRYPCSTLFFLMKWRLPWNLSSDHSELMDLHGARKGVLNQHPAHTSCQDPRRELFEDSLGCMPCQGTKRHFGKRGNSEGCSSFCADRIKCVSPQKLLRCSAFMITNGRPMRQGGWKTWLQ